MDRINFLQKCTLVCVGLLGPSLAMAHYTYTFKELQPKVMECEKQCYESCISHCYSDESQYQFNDQCIAFNNMGVDVDCAPMLTTACTDNCDYQCKQYYCKGLCPPR